MPEYHSCPYFGGGIVEITDERYRHVLRRHHDFALAYWERSGETIQDPHFVIEREQDRGAVLLYRWYDDIDKYVMVAVRSDLNGRHWLATAYMTWDIVKGELLWVRS